MTATVPLPTELPEAALAQVEDARDTLRRDAEEAGVARPDVDGAVDRAAALFRDARVHAFIGILVEREVRASLGLPRSRG